MGTRILVVDDDPATVGVLELVLTAQGYDVQSCLCPQLALKRLASDQYDVLLTDQIMPNVTGSQLVEAAKRLARAPRCFIMSGLPPSEDAGALFIEKPLDVDELLRKLAS